MLLQTKVKKEREKKYSKIRRLYIKLTTEKGHKAMVAEQMIMKKFSIKARSTVWYIIHKPKKKVDQSDTSQ